MHCSARDSVIADFLVPVVHDDEVWRIFGNTVVEEQLARDSSAWIRHGRVIAQRHGVCQGT